MGGLLLTVALGVGAYFLLTIFAGAAYVLWCERQHRRCVERAERRAFERHVAKELRDDLRVIGGSRITSDERYGRPA